MATEPVTHILALAASDFRNTESALAGQDIGAALDTDLAAVGALATCADLRSLARRVGRAAGHEYGSGKYYRRVRAWERGGYARIRARALALFPGADDAAWIADLRGPVGP
jgi:hypothetical protein